MGYLITSILLCQCQSVLYNFDNEKTWCINIIKELSSVDSVIYGDSDTIQIEKITIVGVCLPILDLLSL